MSSRHKQKNIFTPNEFEFVKNNEICRIATSYNNQPHVVPVCYIYIDNFFYFVTDYNTKKYRDLVNNNSISMILDEYDPKRGNKAIIINGSVNFIEKGLKFFELYKVFEKKFPCVKRDP